MDGFKQGKTPIIPHRRNRTRKWILSGNNRSSFPGCELMENLKILDLKIKLFLIFSMVISLILLNFR